MIQLQILSCSMEKEGKEGEEGEEETKKIFSNWNHRFVVYFVRSPPRIVPLGTAKQ